MNRIFLTVRLGEDPKLNTFNNGNKVAKFVAYHRPSYAKEGGKDVRVYVEGWNGLSTSIVNNLTKGDIVIVCGEYKAPEDNNGRIYPTIMITENVEFIRIKKFNQNDAKPQKKNYQKPQQKNYQKSHQNVENESSNDEVLDFGFSAGSNKFTL
mgnify:CR=1 FL=1